MRVLFVSSGNSQYSISPFIGLQAESLAKIGVNTELFRIKGKGINGYLYNILRLHRFLKRSNFDVIHAHYGLCGIVGQFARRYEKLIVSFMGDDLIGSVNSKGKYSLFGNLLVWVNKYFATHHYDYVITKSEQMKEKLHHLQNLAVIPNGVDFSRIFPIDKNIARHKLGIKANRKLIIFVSNPTRSEKNYPLAQLVCQLMNKDDIQLSPVFNKSIEELNLFYNAADILLLTSYHEGSPNVIKEAMACNCPIVSTDVGDVRWVIGDTEGCYISSFDPNDVALKIKWALEFSEQKGRTNGRERIIKLGLDSESVARKIIEIYQKVLKAN